MNVTKTIAAGLVALSALAAAPASAGGVSIHIESGYNHYHGGGYHWKRHQGNYGTLTPREVRAVLRDRGYRQIRYLDRRGRIYEVRATNHRGHRVGLVISARSGAILNVYRL